MKKCFLLTILVVVCASTSFSQARQKETTRTATGVDGATSINAAEKTTNLQNDTPVAARLQNALDVRKAKVGDQVVLKTTEAIKSGDQTIVNKGALLRGHVTDVKRSAGKQGESSMTMVFDRLENGSLTMPVTATINSITQVTQGISADNDLFAADADARYRTSAHMAPPSVSTGGLLGGVSSTTGSVLSSTTGTLGGTVSSTRDTLGSTVNSTSETVGNSTSTVGRTVSGIRISQPVSASTSGESTLSLTSDNLRLEKGTSFNLALDPVMTPGSVK